MTADNDDGAAPGNGGAGGAGKPGFSPKRLLPLVLVVAALAAAYATGLHEQISLRNIAENQQALLSFVDANLAVALLAFVAVYAASVAISLPGAAVLTVLGGFLFGPWLGVPTVVVAATLGATIIFLIAKTALGDTLAARAGPAVEKLRAGFREDALNYLLFLRLVPVFPFWLVNIAPALLGVPLGVYVLGTFVGIVPGTAAYTLVGAGLGSILEEARQEPAYQTCLAAEASGARPEGSCALPVELSSFVTTEIVLAFAALGVVALIPPLVKRLRGRKTAA